MRKFLFLGVSAAALALAPAASQAAVISYQVLDGSTVIGSGNNAQGGSLSIAGSDSVFSVSGMASAYPFLTSPNFSTNNFDLTSGGAAGTLTIKVTEVGLTSFVGNVMNTFTLNSLTAASTFLSGTISNYFDASNAAYGTGTLLATQTFTGIDSFSSSQSASASMPGTFSETTIYTLNFQSGSSSSMSSSSQLIAVPEPTTLALLTLPMALLGLVALRRKDLGT